MDIMKVVWTYRRALEVGSIFMEPTADTERLIFPTHRMEMMC